MNSKNKGNIKLASLLFILGSSSALLLIPAVVQKESIESRNNYTQGKLSPKSEIAGESSSNQFAQKYEEIKKEYIDLPIQKVSESTKEITNIIENPTKIIYQEKETTVDGSNPLSFILGEKTTDEKTSSTSLKSEDEAMIKITKQMVDNCKMITEEYNKAVK